MNAAPAPSAPQPAGIDRQVFAIGVLGVTATILLVGFLMLASQPRSALAVGMIDRSGDYIMLTQQLSNAQEGIVVIDAGTKRMNMYLLDANTKKLGIVQAPQSLDRLPARGREGRR